MNRQLQNVAGATYPHAGFQPAAIRPQFGPQFRPRFGSGLLAHIQSAAFSLILVVIFLYLPVYVETLDPTLLPKYFYFGIFAIAGPLLILKPRQLISYLLSPYALWAVLLVVLNAIHYVSAQGESDLARTALIGTRMQYIAMAAVLGFAFSVTRTALYEKTFVVLAIVAPCLVAVDFAFPGLFYPAGLFGTVPGRGSATFLNPTIAGEVILITFLMACSVVKVQHRTPLLLLAGVGVVLTFSRNAILAWVLLWAYLLYKKSLPKSAMVLALVALFSLPLLGGFEAYLSSRKDLDGGFKDVQARLNFFSNPNLKDESAQERKAVLEGGWQLFLDNPVTGEGAGVTDVSIRSAAWPHPVGPHNQLIVLGAEYGIVGIILWGFLASALRKGKYFRERALQSSAFFLFLFMTMFTHNMFEFPYWLVTYALVAGKRTE